MAPPVFVEPLLVAIQARLTSATFAACLDVVKALAEYSDIAGEFTPFADTFRARIDFSRQYPHAQIYPLVANFEPSVQHYAEADYFVNIDVYARATSQELVERIGRGYAVAVDNCLRDVRFSGLATMCNVVRHAYTDALPTGGSTFVGGCRVELSYKLDEVLQ